MVGAERLDPDPLLPPSRVSAESGLAVLPRGFSLNRPGSEQGHRRPTRTRSPPDPIAQSRRYINGTRGAWISIPPTAVVIVRGSP